MSQTVQSDHPLVVIAESTRESRDRYERLLEEAGYSVAAVPYDEAASASRSMRPSLIILQLGDPARSGLGMVRELRTQAETRGTPLITLVRFDDAHTREQIVRSGATAILIDPVKPSTLLRQLRRLHVRALAASRPPAVESAEVSRG